MNLFIILATFFGLLFSGFFSSADVILLPEKNVPFSVYRAACEKPGYVCTDKYFFDQITTKETVQFDELVNLIDLSSSVYLQSFTKNLTLVLQKEILSEEQLEMAIRLTSQIKELIANKNQISLLETELKQMKEFLEKSAPPGQVSSFVVLFKRKVSEEDFKKLKSTMIKFSAVRLDFASLPVDISTRQKQSAKTEALLNGACEKAQLNSAITLVGWQPYSSERCSLAESLSVASKSVTTSFIENKKWWVTGAVIIGAAILLNQYEVQFQF